MSVALGTGSPQQPLATPTSPPTAERTYTEEELGELPVSGVYCTLYIIVHSMYMHVHCVHGRGGFIQMYMYRGESTNVHVHVHVNT